MEQQARRIVAWGQGLRTKLLTPVGKWCYKLGLHADFMTALSLFFGVAAVYFLFLDHRLFLILGAAHYAADGLDGVIARVSKETNFGKYFDYICDRAITFLLVLKVGLVLQEPAAYAALAIFVLVQGIYVYSKMETPILFTRSLCLLFAAVHLPALIYLVTGVASTYVLGRQIQWFMARRERA